jgi:hypothetical protein
MTGTGSSPATVTTEVQELAGDLCYVWGMLSEVATVWRRAQPSVPGLPLRLPLVLQDEARQLAADIQASARPGPGPGTVPRTAERLAALKRDVAGARALSSRPGCPETGDEAYWESIYAALDRASGRLAA